MPITAPRALALCAGLSAVVAPADAQTLSVIELQGRNVRIGSNSAADGTLLNGTVFTSSVLGPIVVGDGPISNSPVNTLRLRFEDQLDLGFDLGDIDLSYRSFFAEESSILVIEGVAGGVLRSVDFEYDGMLNDRGSSSFTLLGDMTLRSNSVSVFNHRNPSGDRLLSVSGNARWEVLNSLEFFDNRTNPNAGRVVLDVSGNGVVDVNSPSFEERLLMRDEGSRIRVRDNGVINTRFLQLDSANATLADPTVRLSGNAVLQVGENIFGDTESLVLLEDNAALTIGGRTTSKIVVNSAGSRVDLSSDNSPGMIDLVQGTLRFVSDGGLSSVGSASPDSVIEVPGTLLVNTTPTITAAGTINANDISLAAGANLAITADISANSLTTSAGSTLSKSDEGALVLTVNATDNSGRITVAPGDALRLGDLTNRAPGDVKVTPGASAVASTVDNSGFVNLDGTDTFGGTARFESEFAFENRSLGVVRLADAELRARGGLVNEGDLRNEAGRSILFGDITSSGSVTITQDTSLTLFDDLSNNGTVDVGIDGILTIFGTYSGAGSIGGGGDVNLLGGFSVGNSPAAVDWDASLFLGPSSSSLIEIAGTANGMFDRISITGDFAIAGDLDVAFLDGFLLEEGMRFDVFNVQGSTSGLFNGLAEGALIGTFNGVDLFLTYDDPITGGVSLFSVPTPGAFTLLIGAGLFARRRRA